MAYNGSGTYVTTNPPPFTYNTIISETQMNAAFTDIANALSAVLVRDGQAAMTGTLNMGAQNITAIGNGSAASPSLRWGDGQGFYRSAANEISVSTNGTLRQTLQSDGTWLFGTTATQWKVDSSNRLLNPGNTQPAFTGYSSANQTTAGTYSSYSELFDHGGVFNPSTGIFTAPVAGVYVFLYHMVGTFSATGYIQGALQINGTTNVSFHSIQGTNTGANYSHGYSFLIKLSANDNVKVVCTGSSGANIWTCERFSGYLLG